MLNVRHRNYKHKNNYAIIYTKHDGSYSHFFTFKNTDHIFCIDYCGKSNITRPVLGHSHACCTVAFIEDENLDKVLFLYMVRIL
jgi:hypothetical protein